MTDTYKLAAAACRASGWVFVLSAFVAAGWAALPQSWAASFKPAQVRPAPPKFRVQKKELSAAQKNAAMWRTGLSSQAAYGHDLTKVPGHVDPLRFRFFEAGGKPLDVKPELPKTNEVATDRYAALRDWYEPAANLARKRGIGAFYAADRARREYSEHVGETRPIDTARVALGTPAALNALHDAEQLANRLIHAALEDAPHPSSIEPPVSADNGKERLIAALNRADTLGVRPIGSRVWSDLLSQEFPPDVYQPKGTVFASGEPGVVNYVVKSWLLPPTQTSVDVAAVASQRSETQNRWKTLVGNIPSSK